LFEKVTIFVNGPETSTELGKNDRATRPSGWIKLGIEAALELLGRSGAIPLFWDE